jgi:hypothetical protein
MQELLIGLVPGLPPSLRAQILARAEGVPLYAVETVRMLLDRGLLVEDGSAYKVVGALASLILQYQPQGKVLAVIQGNDSSVKEFEDATGLSLKFGDVGSVMAPPNANAKKKDDKKDEAADQAPAFGAPRKDTRGFALVVRTGPHEFLVAGSGVVILS